MKRLLRKLRCRLSGHRYVWAWGVNPATGNMAFWACERCGLLVDDDVKPGPGEKTL
jgi:hypothetical protein